ncbi:hypothetical protein LINGRAHAP2_LOCUS1465, partial [Linum grandiflorum]
IVKVQNPISKSHFTESEIILILLRFFLDSPSIFPRFLQFSSILPLSSSQIHHQIMNCFRNISSIKMKPAKLTRSILICLDRDKFQSIPSLYDLMLLCSSSPIYCV